MDELFTRYMYYERAKQRNRKTTTEALRKFYEKDKYALLKKEETLKNLEDLAEIFGCNVCIQDDIFSDRILRKLFVLKYAPNGMWTYLVSVYFLKNKNENGELEEEEFYYFLNKIIAFIWAYALVHPGVNALRTPAYPEMINIIDGFPVEFKDYKFDAEQVKNVLDNYSFTKGRPYNKINVGMGGHFTMKNKIY